MHYKKIVLVCAAACAATAATAASQVMLYGIVDTAVTYVSDKQGARSIELNSGNLNTSRLGLRGREDIGAGLAAIFNLEAGTAVDTGGIGSASAFWNRQAWLGMASQQWGDLKLGYQRPSFYDLLGPLSHTPPFGAPAARIDGAGIAGSSLAKFNNTIGTTRYSNSIKYVTPPLAGFTLHAFTALGEVPGMSSAGRTLNLGVGYKNRSLIAGLSYLTTECKDGSSCAVGQDQDQVLGAGLGYDFGSFKLSGIYTQQKNAKNIAGNHADTASLTVLAPFKPWTLALGYQILNDKSRTNQDVKQLNLSAVYDLSKRTALYSILARQTVSNQGVAGISFLAAGSSQNQWSVGLRHRF